MKTINEQWSKCPSVLTGGKAYFYVRFYDIGLERTRYCVIWDRERQVWRVDEQSFSRGIDSTLPATYKTPQAAMKFVNELLA